MNMLKLIQNKEKLSIQDISLYLVVYLLSAAFLLLVLTLILNTNSAPSCSLSFNLTSPQSTNQNIVIFPKGVIDNGRGIYPGARFEVDDGSGTNFQQAGYGCDFDSYGPTDWHNWNCTWSSAINRQPGRHTIRLTVKDASGKYANSCEASFVLVLQR